MPGVTGSSVGYIGGDSADPTYESVCQVTRRYMITAHASVRHSPFTPLFTPANTGQGDGHTEALRIEFDPSLLSYERADDTRSVTPSHELPSHCCVASLHSCVTVTPCVACVTVPPRCRIAACYVAALHRRSLCRTAASCPV